MASSYAVSCIFIKISLGLGFLRILNFRLLAARWERIVCYISILISCAVNIEYLFQILFRCSGKGVWPDELASAIVTGICSLGQSGLEASTYVQGSINVITDWILVLLPIPSVFRTTMNWRIRLSITLILLLGGL
jgi:hypothetical protein